MADMHFLGLGGTDEVGASSYEYLLPEGNLLVDAGVRPGASGEAALPNLALLREHRPSAMVLTHAHLDHVAALPLVTSAHPDLPVYCTAPTARITATVLADTLKVSREQGAPLFDARMMKRALERLRVVEPFERVDAHGFSFTLYPSGHLLGACSALIESSGGRVFHTGDFSNVDTPTTRAAYVPPEEVRVDAVVTESTYGDTLLPARREQVRTFVAAIDETLRGGGKVLIPSFALGRAQEIVTILLTAMTGGQLRGVPIYLDGLVRAMTELYEDLLPFLPEALRNARRASGLSPFLRSPVALVEDARHRERILSSREPCVIIASSGMLHAGASPLYARALLPQPENALFVVGYQDAESPGRRLLELRQGGEVLLPDGRGAREEVAALCRVERFYLSAHADRGGILGLLARYPSPKAILTHGEVAPRQSLKSFLDTKRDVSLPSAGEVVPLEDSGRRRGAFVNTAARRLAATKERHARRAVTLRYDDEHHRLVVDLPEDLSPNFFGEGAYTLEVVRGALSRVKLTQRAQDDAEAEGEGQGETASTRPG
ncbi:MBL fold metallo-hydrolase [Deinococcus pimensis]|uniref:MBL fold metallo-hydrolase n=1 Tax=Deinococcus pimensis TaxID=309888 RepID=UPI0004AC72F6|nr:MBL fold metallo-hydrolase [Deinococcus pimensis]